MSSSSFMVASLGFSMYSHLSCHLQTVTVSLLFQFRFPLFHFLLWLPWLGLPKLYWIKVVRVNILVLFLILELFIIEYDVSGRFDIYGFYYVEVCSMSTFWRVFLVVKNLPANTGDIRDACLIPGWGRYPREGLGNPLQYSCLENPMNRGAWWATIHRVAKSQTQLKWFSLHAHDIILE